MKTITIAMIVYVLVCAALVFAVSVYEDVKRRRESHRSERDHAPASPNDAAFHFESRDIQPPHDAPRSRHAA